MFFMSIDVNTSHFGLKTVQFISMFTVDPRGIGSPFYSALFGRIPLCFTKLYNSMSHMMHSKPLFFIRLSSAVFRFILIAEHTVSFISTSCSSFMFRLLLLLPSFSVVLVDFLSLAYLVHMSSG